jgi:hypothetical protein
MFRLTVIADGKWRTFNNIKRSWYDPKCNSVAPVVETPSREIFRVEEAPANLSFPLALANSAPSREQLRGLCSVASSPYLPALVGYQDTSRFKGAREGWMEERWFEAGSSGKVAKTGT